MVLITQSTHDIRGVIRDKISKIQPFDIQEAADKVDSLKWIDSGTELFRTSQSQTIDKYLISYFVMVDGDYILLTENKSAHLWLPNMGHVGLEEHPRVTVIRKANEELGILPKFLQPKPLFVSQTKTVCETGTRTGVSIWYVVAGDQTKELSYDETEFADMKWFHRDDLPYGLSDPNFKRFIQKLYGDQD